ncbi:MAG: phenylalanine--tRNA ligase subunit beta [Hyphomicrobiaceae bacterium]
MKFTLSWLRDHLDTEASLDELTTTLSAIGLEVESVENPAAALADFTIARVVEAKQHPNADRLRVAQVEFAPGKPPVEVVCGAPNCRTGMIGVFAPIGTYIPGTGITLERKPVRGVASNGMLCSEREMQLSDDHVGIVDLGERHAGDIGKRYVDVMGLNDPVIEVKLTPNRPDCTGVRGIARDLAAAGLGTLKPEPALGPVEGDYPCPVDILLEFSADTADACPVFAGRYVKGVNNSPSPDWLQKRLRAVGLRPISSLVDITNYISIDRGRPLHVYDADKLTGAVRARLGKAGEQFVALDGKTYQVEPDMCVIADDAGPLGFGGIMGGEASGCTAATTNVLIESAYFDPLRTAATGRRTGIVSDARYRFERGVDPAFVLPGLDMATDMILKLAGGAPSKAKVAGCPPIEQGTIAFDIARIEKLAGIKPAEADVRRILATLGFEAEGKAALKPGTAVNVMVPTWRPDVHGPADLVEEVVRIVGLDNIPSAPMPRSAGVARPVLTDRQKRSRRARRVLAGRGLVEAVTWSFIPRAQSMAFGGGGEALELMNPISSEMSSMRPSLLPGLLTAAQRNRNRGFADVGLYEIGQAYSGVLADQQLLLASGVRAGRVRLEGAGRHWSGNTEVADVFDVKADVMATLAALGLDLSRAPVTRDAPAWFHPGRSGTLRLGPKIALAHFGELHPNALKAIDVEGPVAAFEIFLNALPAEKRKARARQALTAGDLLPVRRDFAFVLEAKVPAADVVRAASNADKGLIADVSVFDVFEGKSLGEGKKSLAIEVTLQPKDKTLTDAEIEAVASKVIAEVKRVTGGEIRK